MNPNSSLEQGRTRATVSFAWLVLAPFFLTGCGSNLASVTGTVTFEDKPLESGRIVFQAPGRPMAYGELGPGGQYTLNTGDRPGVPPGEYTVTVASYKIGEITGRGNPPSASLTTPAKYSNKDTSDLRAEVRPGDNELDFKLARE